MYDGIVQDLIDELGRLPGVGPKSAQRIAFHIIQTESFDVDRLATILQTVRHRVRFCVVCGNIGEEERCAICRDPRRVPTTICVVEEAKDVVAIERTREYRGLYHVLGGALNPMQGVGPDQLRVASLMTRLQDDLPEVFAAIRETGCLTAIDAAGDGGTMDPLARILPHLDLYVPSEHVAQHQTGQSDPRQMIAVYRQAGATGFLGIKLGMRGALLSPRPGEFVEVAVVKAPGAVVDTTGAGDCFLGGLLTGILRGLEPAGAGKLAAAAGACCVTGLGGTSACRGYDDTASLAGIA